MQHFMPLQALFQLECVEGARDREAYYTTIQTMPLLPIFLTFYVSVIYGGVRLASRVPQLRSLPFIREDVVLHRRTCLDVRP